jgi:hypothetical protein
MYYTGNDLIDLEMELQENKEEANPSNSNRHNKQAADLMEFIFFGGQSAEGGHVGISNR